MANTLCSVHSESGVPSAGVVVCDVAIEVAVTTADVVDATAVLDERGAEESGGGLVDSLTGGLTEVPEEVAVRAGAVRADEKGAESGRPALTTLVLEPGWVDV